MTAATTPGAGAIDAPSRLFAELRVTEAIAYDCRELIELTEQTIREGSIAAIAWLHKLRAAGADIAIVDGMTGVPVAVVFEASLGTRLPVVSEELLIQQPDGRWTRRDRNCERDQRSVQARSSALPAVARGFALPLSVAISADLVERPVAQIAESVMSLPILAVCASAIPAVAAVPILRRQRARAPRPRPPLVLEPADVLPPAIALASAR